MSRSPVKRFDAFPDHLPDPALWTPTFTKSSSSSLCRRSGAIFTTAPPDESAVPPGDIGGRSRSVQRTVDVLRQNNRFGTGAELLLVSDLKRPAEVRTKLRHLFHTERRQLQLLHHVCSSPGFRRTVRPPHPGTELLRSGAEHLIPRTDETLRVAGEDVVVQNVAERRHSVAQPIFLPSSYRRGL